MNNKLVFTGGHHTSALALAQQLTSQGWEIHWFGHRHSMWGDHTDSAEFTEVKQAGLKFYDLKAGKFYRTFNPLKLVRLPIGLFQSLFWLAKIKPCGVVTFGGYLAAPTVISAWLLNIPSLIHDQTTHPGWANRLSAYFASKICLAFPDNNHLFPAAKTELVGLPLRPEIVKLLATPITKNSTPTLLVIGGKQGSHTINSLIFSALPNLLKKYHVIHQTGSSSVYSDSTMAAQIKSQLPVNLRDRYQPCPYLFPDQLATAYSKATVILSRSGAHSVYEFGLLATPTVLIPLPNSSHHEQLENALLLANHHLAVVLPQSEIGPQTLESALETAIKLTGQPLSLPTNATERMAKICSDLFVCPD
jgi:UDP-N-acetylglucosamine--N-acetylmuramyl-(pentapeptide) pyrophosphoryl-undecaprenol N-acetylglucosamine transferase